MSRNPSISITPPITPVSYLAHPPCSEITRLPAVCSDALCRLKEVDSEFCSPKDKAAKSGEGTDKHRSPTQLF